MADIGKYQPNEFYATINPNAAPQVSGFVRLTTHIRYGQGYGIRFIDLSIEEAEALGVDLIQTAQVAHDLKVRKDAEDAARLVESRRNLDAAIAQTARAS